MKHVSDYRCGRKTLHNLSEMLTCIISGYVNGRTSVVRALRWCEDNIKILKKHMKLKGGIPSEATVSRMLNGIDEEEPVNEKTNEIKRDKISKPSLV